MNVRSVKNEEKEQWNDFVFRSPQGTFLQSWQWGEMQRELGTRFWRLVVEENQVWQAAALVLQRELPLGRGWLYLPRGPVFRQAEPAAAIWDILQRRIVNIAQQQAAMFIRCDPLLGQEWEENIGKAGWRKAEREIQPKHTLKLDLSLSEHDLLQQMHAKTRYNIRLASKHGLTVRFSREEKDLEQFLQLTQDVMERTKFRYHPPMYYRAMLRMLGSEGMMEVALAEQFGQVLAAHIIISAGPVTTYAHGASSSTHRHLMAPYLLHWETIKRAQAKGARVFDFFGVAPAGAQATHSWAGITRFKKGFGGWQEDYLGTYDLVLDQGWYGAFNFARRMRQALR